MGGAHWTGGASYKLFQWGLGVASAANDFGHYTHNFVRLHAYFNAFWNITGRANKTDPIRPPLPATGLEGARAPCASHLDPPMAGNCTSMREANSAQCPVLSRDVTEPANIFMFKIQSDSDVAADLLRDQNYQLF